MYIWVSDLWLVVALSACGTNDVTIRISIRKTKHVHVCTLSACVPSCLASQIFITWILPLGSPGDEIGSTQGSLQAPFTVNPE